MKTAHRDTYRNVVFFAVPVAIAMIGLSVTDLLASHPYQPFMGQTTFSMTLPLEDGRRHSSSIADGYGCQSRRMASVSRKDALTDNRARCREFSQGSIGAGSQCGETNGNLQTFAFQKTNPKIGILVASP